MKNLCLLSIAPGSGWSAARRGLPVGQPRGWRLVLALLLLVAGLPLTSLAQPPANDNCANAVLLTPATPGMPTAGTVGEATDSGIGNALGTPDDDVWYRFVATRTQHHITVTPTAGTDLVQQLYAGACPAPADLPLFTSDPENMIAYGLTPGQTYRIRVHSYFATPADPSLGTFTISVNEPGPPPANDNCAAATLLVPTSPCTGSNGTLAGATYSGINSFGTSDDDVWYRFVATSSQHNIVVASTRTADLVHELFDTCPGPMGVPLVTSDPEDMLVTGLTVGQTYYLRVYSYTDQLLAPADNGFTVCVNLPAAPPANDNCAAAVLLTPATPCAGTSGTVGGATQSEPPSSFGTPHDDVWYHFVATSAQHHITVTPANGADLVHELFGSSCPGPSDMPLFSSDPDDMLATGLTVGQTYYLRVYSFYTSYLTPAGGAFSICVDNPGAVLANDECSGAVALTNPGASCVATNGTVFGATQSTVTGSTPGTADDDVWYRFVATSANAGIYLTTTGGLDLVVDLRSGVCATSSTLRSGDQSGGTVGSVDSISVRNLVVGQPYLVRVYSYFAVPATAANGTFTLCVTTPGTCAPPTMLAASNLTNTTASLGWTAGASSVGYTVEYGPAGFVPGTGTVLNTGTNFASLTGLTASTAYQFYVTQACGSGLSSVRVGPQSFSTTGLNNLIVSAGQTLTNVQGAYDNVTVEAGGSATLAGPLAVAQTLTVQAGGILATNCQQISGPGNFVLAAGAELRICDAAGIFASGNNGPIRVSGTRSFSPDATYTYNGSTPQSTGPGLPATVRTLVLNNATGLTLNNGGLSIRQVLRLSSGSLNTNAVALTLLSDIGGTALVDNTGGAVIGAVQVRRYVAASLNGGLGYRHLSSAVQNAPVSALGSSGSPVVVNPAYNAATALVKPTITPYPTVFYYLETAVPAGGNSVDDFNQGWQSPLAPSDIMPAGRGYTVQVAGNQTIALTGALNNGPLVLGGQTYGSTGSQAGWHHLGNPYASPLDWSTMTVGSSSSDNLQNMSGAVYVFQSSGQYAGTYRSYQNGFGGDPLIASGQSFFVRTAGVGQTGTVRMSNANRVTTWSAANSTLYRGNDPRTHLVLALASPNAPTDQTTVYFESGATAAPDARFDAAKLRNPGATNIFSLAGADELDINGLPLLSTGQVVVPLGYAVAAPGSYTLSVAALANLPATTGVWLRDAHTGTLTDLRRQATYAFAATAGSLSSRVRFALVFGPANGVLSAASQLDAAQVALFPNPARREVTLQLPALRTAQAVTAQLFNALGQAVLVRELPLTGTGLTTRFDLRSLPAGVYSLRLTAAGMLPITKRLAVE